MAELKVMPEAEPFFFEGSDIGVLVSHGYTGTTQSMRFLGESLARQGGFTVIGPRLPGHGTTPEDMAQSTAEQWIRELEKALDVLRSRCSHIFVTGLSMGGTLALYMAAQYPDVFRGVIPINAVVVVNSPALAALAFAPNAPATLPGIGSDIKQPGITELAYPAAPTTALRQLYALVAVTHDLLPNVTCPTLVFTSRDDHVVNPANGPYIIDHIGAQDKRLVWLENSYHVATLDNDKDLIASEMTRFIQAHA